MDSQTVQFIEAHATSTPVGDSTEFEALLTAFAGRPAALPPIYLQSVKALIGHTGWLSGAASIVKLCKAFEARTMPPQFNFETPNPAIQLASSPFTIPLTACAWPANVDGLPRRAAVSGFGFGGSNAHLVLEEYEREYHQRLAERARPIPARTTLAVVAVGSQFPREDGALTELPAATFVPLRRDVLRLPSTKRLLPDALEKMDTTQFLASLAADRSLQQLRDWAAHRERIGVALGLAGKTPRAVAAIERVFLDQLRRVLTQRRAHFRMADGDFERLRDKLLDLIARSSPPSNAYTMIGMMPNLAAGRAANLFDLKGPNIVVDAGNRSLLTALRTAELWLMFNEADVVLAGALQTELQQRPSAGDGASRSAAELHEGACVFALATVESAQASGWPVLARMAIGGPGDDVIEVCAGATAAPTAAGQTPDGSTIVIQPRARLSREVTGLAELARAVDTAV